MPTGKAVNLKVRPLQAADMCFPADGIIEFLPGETLGRSVPAYSLPALYNRLGAIADANLGRLRWDADAIFGELSPRAVARLRAEPVKADIDNAVAMRQNAFLTTYATEVVDWARRTYHDDRVDNGNVAVWSLLFSSWLAQWGTWNSLQKSYTADGVFVVKKARTDTTYSSIVKGPLGDEQYTNTAGSKTDATGFEYRNPLFENDARFFRGSANTRQEFFNAIRMREKCKFADITFTNELASLDREIKKLQISYTDTFLVAPFAGVVTGLFANEGDFVRSGQPVLRLENDTSVFLVGTIKYRGLLKVNDRLSVTTTLFDAEGGTPTKIEGTVAAVRGHDSVDEQWDILVRCKNRTAANTAIVPVNYNFDFESTTIEIVTA